MKYIWLIIITIFSLNLDAKEWEFNASGYYENKEMKLADNTKLLHYESKELLGGIHLVTTAKQVAMEAYL